VDVFADDQKTEELIELAKKNLEENIQINKTLCEISTTLKIIAEKL